MAPAQSTELAALLRATVVDVDGKLHFNKGIVEVDQILRIGNLRARALARLLVDSLPFVLPQSFLPVGGKHGWADRWKKHAHALFSHCLLEDFEFVDI